MSSRPHSFSSYAQFPVLMDKAVKKRLALRQWRDQILGSEHALRTALTSCEIHSGSNVELSHPLAARWPRTESHILDNLLSALAQLADARQKATQARQELARADSHVKQAEEQRATQLMLGLLLLIVLIGIWFLIRWFDDSTLRAAKQQQEDSRRRSEAAAADFQAAKAEALRALQRFQNTTQRLMAEEFEEDAVNWHQVLQSLPVFFRGDWSAEAWKAHDFSSSHRAPFWLAGMASEQLGHGGTPYMMPVLMPLLGGQMTTLLKGSAADSLALMHGLVLQLATMIPYGATFTLLDPSGAGRAFPMQRSLPFLRPIGVDIARDLESVWDDIGRIIKTHLDAEVHSFDQLPEQTQANERYEFIFAANFPDGYDRRTIETLQKIAKNGPVAGKYLFIQHSDAKQLPRDLSWQDFGGMAVVDIQNPPKPVLEGMAVQMLRGPDGTVQTLALQHLNAAKPPEHNVEWSHLTGDDPTAWWTQRADTLIEAPVGSVSRGNHIHLWFGVQRDGRPCAHGILGAMPGSGKSNLYHVFICGLATRYSPEELNLYLIDGKMGVEFQAYRRLPHARAVALNSAPELSRSVLAELVAEMERRNELFGRLKVVDLPAYRNVGSPDGPRPRIVLMIDEYQELFEDDRMNQASAHLLTLAQQGRSAGIHLLLGSQRFGAAGMLNQAAVFGSIHLRIAMRMSQSDVQGLTEFGRNGRRLVEQCDIPGKVVVNSNSGDDNSNEFGKVALLDHVRRASLLEALEKKADREWPAEQRFATVVFDGREQPNFSENPQMVDLIRLPHRPDETAWRKIAVAPVHEQGFGVPDWYAGERPMALWVGQELNVHGQARVILRRRAMENVLLVGENLNATYGILAGLLCSVAVGQASGDFKLHLVDRAIPGTPWEGLLDSVCSRIFDCHSQSPNCVLTKEARVATRWLDEWTLELQRRSTLEEAELQRQPTWLLVIAGADRMPPLAKVTSTFGSTVDSPDGEKLKSIYVSGPILGLHVVMSFPSASSLKQCLDRAQLEHFKHRVVTQMADGDSFLLLGNDQAAKLQRGNSRPVFAICQDTAGGTSVKFKPYTVDAQISWSEQLSSLVPHLNRWKETHHVNG
ncbi:FtsK/SpoIIIE domain-containing protein [Roseimicrobium gellanilyticum]|nr:FtsK/SpoIIIE domain-containing protein [Roseimicrobium gellanilyticum]